MGMHRTDTDDDLEYHPPTREEVLATLEGWRQRLSALYADIISWLPASEGYETEIRNVMADESTMRHAGVSPQPVPELRVLQHGAPVATFSPDSCWIIGVLGRVMVSTDKHHRHKLVEVDFPASERGWRLYRSDWPRPELGKPLDIRWRRGIQFDRLSLIDLVRRADG